MKILIADSTKKTKLIGETPEMVIPRIGEKIWLGYNPPPVITDIVYILEENSVYVCIDGFVLS